MISPGARLFGIYALSQACVVVTYWAVFSLGRAIVGPQHAALAVLLMVGIAVFTVPTPDFGPLILAMPLWALVLLHYWRAVGEGKRAYWLALAIEVGSAPADDTISALILVALLVLFTVANERARRSLHSYDPLIAAGVAVLLLAPHLLWLVGSARPAVVVGLRTTGGALLGGLVGWLRLLALILAAHAGLLILVGLVAGWPWPRRDPAPVIVRFPIDPFARQFVYFCALAPPCAGTLAPCFSVCRVRSAASRHSLFCPALLWSSLAGDAITLTRQHIVIAAWFGLLLVPPIMAAVAVMVLPWLNIDLRVGQPVQAMARFFSESFERRTNLPLQIVGGEPRTAALIALAAPTRPSLFLDAAPGRSPWVGPEAIKRKGAILAWPSTGTGGTAPPGMTERFPGLVAEVPRAFERRVQGRLPLLRIGWALLRPQSDEGRSPPDTPTPQPGAR